MAAAEWLIDNHYTRAARLAIKGRSNGGLLVAACMLQRPDLFGAVVCEVPVTDMLRYHQFTAGRLWVDEYGNAETTPQHFAFLYAYSPLHHITSGVVYPPTLITTADTDDRVVPLHALKFTAALQAADAGVNPILLRLETDAGHGLGKPTGKVIDELQDIYAFLFAIFDMSQEGA
jgi:prolyl oligopeptidase